MGPGGQGRGRSGHPFRGSSQQAVCRYCHELADDRCQECGRHLCRAHALTCPRCGGTFCRDHLGPQRRIRCQHCGRWICHAQVVRCQVCNEPHCPEHLRTILHRRVCPACERRLKPHGVRW